MLHIKKLQVWGDKDLLSPPLKPLHFQIAQIVIKFLFFSPERKMSNYNLTEKGYEQEFVWMARLFWT